MEIVTGNCTAVVLKDIWGAKVSSDSRIVEGSNEEIWEVSGVTCELGVVVIKTPVTVCTPKVPAIPSSHSWKRVFHAVSTGHFVAEHVI